MIKLLLDIKHRCPWIWDAIERLNGCLFRLRSRKPESVVSALPAKVPEGFRKAEKDHLPILKTTPGHRTRASDDSPLS